MRYLLASLRKCSSFRWHGLAFSPDGRAGGAVCRLGCRQPHLSAVHLAIYSYGLPACLERLVPAAEAESSR